MRCQDQSNIREFENQEWLDSIDYIIEHEDTERVDELIELLKNRVQEKGIRLQMHLNTSYINTISAKEEASYPGDRDLERKIKSIIRWNAKAMVVQANRKNDAKVIPAVIYTEPEIATFRLSEKEAKGKGINYKMVKFPWSASGRSVAMNAGDMIPELVLAIEMAATAQDVALTIHPHPTLSENIMDAAEMFYGHPAHTLVKKK